MSAKTRSCPACQTLYNLESAEVVESLYLTLDKVCCLVVYLLIRIVLVAKSPVIPAAALSEYSCFGIVPPLYKVVGCFVGTLSTPLDNFWLHINENCIWNEAVFLSAKKCFYYTLSYQWARLFHLLKQLLKECKPNLVSTLTYLNRDH